MLNTLHSNFISYSLQFYKIGAVITSILQLRKLKAQRAYSLPKVIQPALSHVDELLMVLYLLFLSLDYPLINLLKRTSHIAVVPTHPRGLPKYILSLLSYHHMEITNHCLWMEAIA